jgi:heme exporter protein D
LSGFTFYLTMGGYADFVWPAYGLTLAVLIILGIASFRSARNRACELESLQAASPHRKRRAAAKESPAGEVSDGL